MKKILVIFFIIQLILAQVPSYAVFWHKDDLGNKIKQEEYPDSKDVEPKADEVAVIKGGVENSIDISLEECLKFAFGIFDRWKIHTWQIFVYFIL